jgi:ATP synthase protein I
MPASGKGPGRPAGELTPEEREAFARRSEALGRKLDAAKDHYAPAPPRTHVSPGTGYGLAFRFAADLVIGVAVGGFIGWLLDRQLGTSPWLLALFVILGFGAGLSNIIRLARRMQAENEAAQRAAPSVPDDDTN